MAALGFLLWSAIGLYLMLLTARAVLSFVPMFVRDWRPRGMVLVVAEGVYTLTDPPLRALRRVLKPVRVGDISLDLGFLLLFMGLSMLQRLVASTLG